MQREQILRRMHDIFYKNVYMLTLVYPTSDDFKLVFKKNMFIKTNISGFQQLIYFLLEILEPERLKQRISFWPPYDKRTENQFRNEVVNLINDLNSYYDNWNLPHLMASQVISPGGFKFVKFMLKLSNLVLLEHFKCNPTVVPNILLPLQKCKQEKITLEAIERCINVSNNINIKIDKLLSSFNNKLEITKANAQKIVDEQAALNEIYKRREIKLSSSETTLKETLQETELKTTIEENLAKLKSIKEIFEELQILNLNSNITLEYNNEFQVPKEICNILSLKDNTLDLINLIESSTILTDCRRMEAKPLHEHQRLAQLKKFEELNQTFRLILEDMETVVKIIRSVMKDKENINDYDLAVPL